MDYVAHTAGSCQGPAGREESRPFVASAAAEGSARTGSRWGCDQRLSLHRVPCARLSRRPHPRTAAGPGWRVAGSPGAVAHRLGAGAAPPAVRAGGVSPGAALGPAVSGSGELPGREAGPGSGAGSPRAPRAPLSPQRSPSFVPLSNRRSRPIAIEPAGPAAR